MKRLLVVVWLLGFSSCFAGQIKGQLPPVGGVGGQKRILPKVVPALGGKKLTIKLDSVPLSNLIRLYYGQITQQAFVLGDDVVSDVRPVSVFLQGDEGAVGRDVVGVLSSYGYVVEKRSGVVYVRKETPPDVVDKKEFVVYRPKFRSSAYLIGTLRAFFPQITSTLSSGAAHPPVSQPVSETSAAALLDAKTDYLVFDGSVVELKRFKDALGVVDVPSAAIELRTALVEVTTSKMDSSAFGLVINALHGKLTGSLGGVLSGSDSLGLAVGGIDAVLSALKTDSRFHVVSAPRLRVTDGAQSRLTVGEDVPVLGQVVTGQGVASQSVDYRSSGVILTVTPHVHSQVVELDLDQQLSSFAETTTGVNTSPTLTKRELMTSLSLSDGEVAVMGGLSSKRESVGHSGPWFLPAFLRSKNSSEDATELMMLVEAKRI